MILLRPDFSYGLPCLPLLFLRETLLVGLVELLSRRDWSLIRDKPAMFYLICLRLERIWLTLGLLIFLFMTLNLFLFKSA